MARSTEEFNSAVYLLGRGLSDSEIGKILDIPRATIRDWRVGKRRVVSRSSAACSFCGPASLDASAYAYLLGLYLGDGCLSPHPRGVFKLRITLDEIYPLIIGGCMAAMEAVRGYGHAGLVQAPGCLIVTMYWKHWPCLFPQHGAGRKHDRLIQLERWQETVVVHHPHLFLRGLMHSDGCRDSNVVNGVQYPRYQFTNHSEDIRRIFCWACDLCGIRYTMPSWKRVSISRRPDVLFLDQYIGPKA